ncbi:unnamed protein product [Penicillium roqueforti FM164]|uniref:Genomic scaffold, ProqFM164S01 n=1 Tax=Penicillium roqueforti (strain FM164) TaxID=1365484 RepID=W6PZA8_PENRF|nr:unnamed protein product [Penicillium roqueforti FM164]
MHLGGMYYWIKDGLGPVFLVLVILRRITGGSESCSSRTSTSGKVCNDIQPFKSPGRPDLNMPGVAEIV